MKHKIYNFILLLLIMTIFPNSIIAGKISIRVLPAERSGKIEVGSKFYIEVEAVNCSGEWKLPKSFGGAKLLYTPSESSGSSVSSINGKTSQTTFNKITYYLLASQAGTFSFGPVSMGATSCKPVKYTIAEQGKGTRTSGTSSQGESKAESNSAPSPSDKPQFIGKGNENMFLRASVSKTTAYEQEAIVYTIKLYTTYQYIKFLGATAAPKFEGFVIEEQKISDASMRFESYNGRTYETAEVAKYIIFPQKTGKLKITGNTYTVSADAMEYYNDPYFSRMAVKRPVQLNLTPNDLIVDVRPLPTPRPADFSGGVGTFTITSNLLAQNFKTNQASTITYTVSGKGNLKYIKLPDMNTLYPSELEVFTPDSKSNVGVSNSNIEGTVNFEYSFIPMETGTFEIPSIKLVYFNPATGKYETSEAKGYTINVGKGAVSSKSQTARRFDYKLKSMNPASLKMTHIPYVYNFTYWLWFIIPTLLLILMISIFAYYSKQHYDMESYKSKRAGKIARRRLKKALDCMRRGKKETFYDEMLASLWGYLSDKLKMPTSELTRQNVSEMLLAHGISADLSGETIRLLDDCEFAKYAPTTQLLELQKVYDRGAEIIEQLNSNFKNIDNETNGNKDEIF